MDNHLIVAGLVMLCAGGVFYALAYPYLVGDAKRAQRQKALQAPPVKRGDRTVDAAKRRAPRSSKA